MAVTTKQIAERLLKKSQGLVDTKYDLGERGITEEGIGTYNLVKPSDIWVDVDKIPSTPPVLVNGAELGVVKYYDKLLMEIVDAGTSVSFKSPNGETQDMVTGRFAFEYTPKIYNTNGTVQIYSGDWMVDAETGVITFYDPSLAQATVNAANPPRISFYKYIGKKGFNVDNSSLTLTGLTVNGNVIVSGGTITGDGSGLTNIPASGVTGLNLDRITSGSNSAIMSSSGLTVNTDILSDKFIKINSTSDDILLGDGQTLSVSALTGNTISAADNRYLPLSGGTLNGSLHIDGNITQSGESWETHVNHVYSSGDTITLRDGAVSALPASGYTGIIAKKYDGDNDGVLVFDKNGIARVGDMDIVNWTGTTQALATREDSPINNGTAYWDDATKKFNTKILTLDDISGYTQNLNEKYVNISGDTINGDLTISGGIIAGDGSGIFNIPISGITGGGIGISGVTIGPAEDGSYEDGIFTDFTPATPIGIAIDRFNEMFKLLAPTPPSDWLSGTLSNTSTTYTARALSTGSNLSITTISTPTFNMSTPLNGLGEVVAGATLSFNIDGTSPQETVSFYGTPTKNSGVIRYVYGDPYAGQSGKAGFWTGFTSVSAVSTALTPSSSLKTANYIHSTRGGKSVTFYLDSPLTVGIGPITATVPEMTGHVSGVKTMTSGQAITNITFNITNVSSYFYAATSVWALNAGIVAGQTGNPSAIPTSYGETGSVNSATTTVLNNKYSENLNFTISGRNSVGTYGSDTTFTDSTKRVDTVSVESERLTSGTGNFPVSFGNAFDSTQSLTDNYTNELQLINGSYKWLAGDYTVFGSPNYSSVTTGDNIGGTHYRWATFNVGNKSTPVNNITITIPDAVIGTSWNAIKMYVKIGDSGWLDATAAQAIGAPYANGDAALNVAASTAYNVRVITFGTVPRSGTVYVRIGIRASDTTFTFKKPTMA